MMRVLEEALKSGTAKYFLFTIVTMAHFPLPCKAKMFLWFPTAVLFLNKSRQTFCDFWVKVGIVKSSRLFAAAQLRMNHLYIRGQVFCLYFMIFCEQVLKKNVWNKYSYLHGGTWRKQAANNNYKYQIPSVTVSRLLNTYITPVMLDYLDSAISEHRIHIADRLKDNKRMFVRCKTCNLKLTSPFSFSFLD